MLTALFLAVWFRWRERLGRIGFYVIFAVMVTMSVQLVGVYLVFTTLIVPAVATYRHAAARQLGLGYALGVASYVVGLAVSVVTDLPSSAVIVWCMALLAIALHLTARNGVAQAGRHLVVGDRAARRTPRSTAFVIATLPFLRRRPGRRRSRSSSETFISARARCMPRQA